MLTGSLMVRHEACMPCDHNHEVMSAELTVVLHECCSYAQKRCRALGGYACPSRGRASSVTITCDNPRGSLDHSSSHA